MAHDNFLCGTSYFIILATFQLDKEVHILLEDQQKINKFARLNSRLDDLKVLNNLLDC